VEMRGSPMMRAVTIVASLLTMVVLAAAGQAFGSATLVEGAVVGAALSIGLDATGTHSGGMFEGRSTMPWSFPVRFAARAAGRFSLSLRAK